LRRIGQSIFFKVAVTIILLQTVVLFAVAVLIQSYQLSLIERLNKQQLSFITNFIEKEKIKQSQEAVRNINNIMDLLEGTVAYSLYNYDEGNLKKVIKSLLDVSVIKCVDIYDSVAGDVFMAGYKDKQIHIGKKLPPTCKSLSSFKKEITYNNDKLGYIIVYYDMKEILKRLNKEEEEAFKLVNKNFEKISMNLKRDQRLLYIYFILATIIVTLAVVFVLFKLVNKPLNELKRGLKTFFNFLANPKIKVQPIKIKTKDEFGEIARFINRGIIISSKLHAELAEYMSVVNKYVAIAEFNSYGFITNVTEAFTNATGFSKEYLIGKKLDFFGIDLEKVLKSIEEKGACTTEIKIFNKWFHSTFTNKHLNKRKDEFIWIAFDITSQKEVEFMKNNLENLLDEKSKEIKKLHDMTMDSIKYASLIQHSILPEKEVFDEAFEDYFIIWEPKDIVGGDIYFLEKISDKQYLLMVIDATGHGVSGAFVTMLIKAIERQIASKEDHHVSPAKILSEFNKSLKTTLHQLDKNASSNAGFDGAVCYIDYETNTLTFSGANLPLFYVEDGEVVEVKGDRYSVGYVQCEIDYEYHEYKIPLDKDGFYITTDGYIDQNGGDKGFPFGKTRFKNIIKNNYKKPFSVQKEIFEMELKLYQKDNDRNDDITVIGFKGKEF